MSEPTSGVVKWNALLESVLVHEIGHVLGLPDACLAGHWASGRPQVSECSADERARAMFPSGLHGTLFAGDVAELCRLYPGEGHHPIPVMLGIGALVLAAVVGAVFIRARRRWRARPSEPLASAAKRRTS